MCLKPVNRNSIRSQNFRRNACFTFFFFLLFVSSPFFSCSVVSILTPAFSHVCCQSERITPLRRFTDSTISASLSQNRQKSVPVNCLPRTMSCKLTAIRLFFRIDESEILLSSLFIFLSPAQHSCLFVFRYMDTARAFLQGLSGLAGSWLASTLVYPLDVAKTRLQLQSEHAEKYSGALDCLWKTYLYVWFAFLSIS